MINMSEYSSLYYGNDFALAEKFRNRVYSELTNNAAYKDTMINKIDDLMELCHSISAGCGWWQNNKGHALFRNFGEVIALIHSELSEALEGDRKQKQDDHLPQYTSVEVELADALIRIFDLAGAMDLRLGDAFVDKLVYNMNRSDHKIENRMAEGGKKY